MDTENLTEYERRRLENMKRNDEKLASLKIHAKVSEMSAATKRQRAQNKSSKPIPEKKSKTETPINSRRSLRSRGLPPDSVSVVGAPKNEFDDPLKQTPKTRTTATKSLWEPGTLSMRDAYKGTHSDRPLIETILSVSNKCRGSFGDGSVEGIDGNSTAGMPEGENWGLPIRVLGSVDLESFQLFEKNVARVVPGKILTVRFFPSTDVNMVVVGNTLGNVGFWNVDCRNYGDGIYLYRPHSSPVSGIAIQPFSPSKMFTCGHDGLIRLMDVEKEEFDLVYSSASAIFSIRQQPDDVNSLYFGDGPGRLGFWDARAVNSPTSWLLHEDRINTIDFNSENSNIMATSSADGTACIWDLRNIGGDEPKYLKTISFKRPVHSAYFSPTGSYVAAMSSEDKIGLLSGANYEDMCMIYHYNQTGGWASPFRAIWGWDDSYIYTGNMTRGVDVISTSQKRNVLTLQSPNISAIPSRFAAHPYKVGMLAAATSGGEVYIWTAC